MAVYVILGVAYVLFPEERALVWLGMAEIPCHITNLPIDFYVLYCSKIYPSWLVTMVVVSACCVAGALDYAVFDPIIRHRRVRAIYENSGIARVLLELFQKMPFVTLLAVGYLPIPFLPFKFLAITVNYPLSKYLLAITVSRTARWYMMARIGYALQPPDWVLITLLLIVLAVTVVRILSGCAVYSDSVESDA
jgi:membrane protein YqaA with SNARE-associated domain